MRADNVQRVMVLIDCLRVAWGSTCELIRLLPLCSLDLSELLVSLLYLLFDFLLKSQLLHLLFLLLSLFDLVFLVYLFL